MKDEETPGEDESAETPDKEASEQASGTESDVKLPEEFQRAIESAVEEQCDTTAKCDYAAQCINEKRMSLSKSEDSFSADDEPKD